MPDPENSTARGARRFRDHGSPTSRWLLVRHAEPNALWRWLNNAYFWVRHVRHLWRPTILYALTPPPWIQNIGDQAQVVAIQAWLRRAFPSLEVLEVNQSESAYFLPALRLLVGGNDLVFLHSGGNLGDRYMGTERPRRLLIQTFPRNTIVSLPQTIVFSDSESGRAERQTSARIYNAHPLLQLLCRDRISARTAASLFHGVKLHCVPDFVLSLPQHPDPHPREARGILICRRQDREALYPEVQWEALARRLPRESHFFDTRFAEPIAPEDRERRLAETLELFRRYEVIVTDRFHAIIFAILCRRPCVALPTIDHKVTASQYWFRGVLYAQTPEDVPALVEQALQRGFVEEAAWNELYFDALPMRLGLRPYPERARLPHVPEMPLAGRWRPVAPYQKREQYEEAQGTVTFRGRAETQDEWCILAADGAEHTWRDFAWSLEFRRQTDFREFAFNFRYRDFDNRYRFRFEAGRIYFDKRIAGVWRNHLASVPFETRPGVWYRLRIEAAGEVFSCFVDGRLLMRNSDPELSDGGVAVVLWETDGRTPLEGAIRDARVHGLAGGLPA